MIDVPKLYDACQTFIEAEDCLASRHKRYLVSNFAGLEDATGSHLLSLLLLVVSASASTAVAGDD